MRSWLLLIVSAVLIPRPTCAQFNQLPAATQRPVGTQNTAVLTGRVASEQGNSPDGSAEVVLDCGGQIRAHAYSAQKGNFSLTISLDASPDAFLAPRHESTIATGEWGSCELYGILAGYKSEHVRLSETPKEGMQDAGTIMLHPASADHSFAVSVTSLAAPEK